MEEIWSFLNFSNEQMSTSLPPVPAVQPRMDSSNSRAKVGKYWICTIPLDKWQAPSSLPVELTYCCGQQEVGKETGTIVG